MLRMKFFAIKEGFKTQQSYRCPFYCKALLYGRESAEQLDLSLVCSVDSNPLGWARNSNKSLSTHTLSFSPILSFSPPSPPFIVSLSSFFLSPLSLSFSPSPSLSLFFSPPLASPSPLPLLWLSLSPLCLFLSILYESFSASLSPLYLFNLLYFQFSLYLPFSVSPTFIFLSFFILISFFPLFLSLLLPIQCCHSFIVPKCENHEIDFVIHTVVLICII